MGSESEPKDDDQASGTQKGGKLDDDSDTEANAEYVTTICNLQDTFDIDLTLSTRFEKRKKGLYVIHTCPDTHNRFLVAKTPSKASKPTVEGEVTLGSLPVDIFITLMTMFHSIRKGVNWLEHGVNTRGKAIHPPRERLTLDAKHVAKVDRGKAKLNPETTRALGLLTNADIVKQWPAGRCYM